LIIFSEAIFSVFSFQTYHFAQNNAIKQQNKLKFKTRFTGVVLLAAVVSGSGLGESLYLRYGQQLFFLFFIF